MFTGPSLTPARFERVHTGDTHRYLAKKDGCSLLDEGEPCFYHGTKRQHYWAWLPIPHWGTLTVMHATCACNELDALARRVFPVVLKPTDKHLKLMDNARRWWHRSAVGSSPLIPMTPEAYVSSVPAHKRKLYARALESLSSESLSRRDARIDLFAKVDKCEGGLEKVEGGKFLKARAIQARGPRFNINFGRFMKPLEHVLYERLVTPCSDKSMPRSRVIAKGLNLKQRADLFWTKANAFKAPVVWVIDASSFDGSISEHHLKQLHGFYCRSFANSPELQRMCSWRLLNKGRSRRGVKYSVRGNRMSGDTDTALGNCCDMTSACFAVCQLILKLKRWDVINDGDDVLLFTERDDHVDADQLQREFAGCGFKTTPESVDILKDGYSSVEFCRSRLVETAGGWTWCRLATRARSTAFVSHKHYGEARPERWLKAQAQCELISSRGLPIQQALASRICRLLAHVPYPRFEGEDFAYKAKYEVRDLRKAVDCLPVTEKARMDYSAAFGISIEEQLVEEARIATLSLNDFTSGWTDWGPMCVPYRDTHAILRDSSERVWC